MLEKIKKNFAGWNIIRRQKTWILKKDTCCVALQITVWNQQ